MSNDPSYRPPEQEQEPPERIEDEESMRYLEAEDPETERERAGLEDDD